MTLVTCGAVSALKVGPDAFLGSRAVLQAEAKATCNEFQADNQGTDQGMYLFFYFQQKQPPGFGSSW